MADVMANIMADALARADGEGYHSFTVDAELTNTLQRELARQPDLELVLLFGSAARDRQRTDSDIDIAVQAGAALSAARKMALVSDMASATGRAIDLIDLRTVGEPLLGQILAHGRRLLGSDAAHGQLLSRHLVDAADFAPYAQRIVDERRRAWIGR